MMKGGEIYAEWFLDAVTPITVSEALKAKKLIAWS